LKEKEGLILCRSCYYSSSDDDVDSINVDDNRYSNITLLRPMQSIAIIHSSDDDICVVNVDHNSDGSIVLQRPMHSITVFPFQRTNAIDLNMSNAGMLETVFVMLTRDTDPMVISNCMSVVSKVRQ
jgi:hypothetical protein